MSDPIEPCAGHPDLDAPARQIALMARGFYERGWMLGTSGSISIKVADEPLALIVTVSGKDKGALGPEDILSVRDEGAIFAALGDPKAASEAFYAGRPRPSGETLVHEAIYRRLAEVGAVTHVHTIDNTLCSQLAPPSGLTLDGLEMLKGIGQWTPGASVCVPVVDNDPHIPTLAALVAEAANPRVPGVLVRGHGIYVWGQDLARAGRHTEIFEFLVAWAIKARTVGLGPL